MGSRKQDEGFRSPSLALTGILLKPMETLVARGFILASQGSKDILVQEKDVVPQLCCIFDVRLRCPLSLSRSTCSLDTRME